MAGSDVSPSSTARSVAGAAGARRDHPPRPAVRESLALVLLHRVKHGLRALSPALHDRVRACYRRSGRLRQRFEVLRKTSRIKELAALTEEGRRRGVLEPEVAHRLAAFVRELRREARAGG